MNVQETTANYYLILSLIFNYASTKHSRKNKISQTLFFQMRVQFVCLHFLIIFDHNAEKREVINVTYRYCISDCKRRILMCMFLTKMSFDGFACCYAYNLKAVLEAQVCLRNRTPTNTGTFFIKFIALSKTYTYYISSQSF